MAAGKSSVGRRLAALLGAPFVDTDAEITKLHGTPAEIFSRKGESAFRSFEEDAVEQALKSREPTVVALGGGAVLSRKTRERLSPYTVVFFTTDAETVLSRANLEKRPLLKDDPGAWERIFKERLPLYQEVATITIDTRSLPKDDIAKQLLAWLESTE